MAYHRPEVLVPPALDYAMRIKHKVTSGWEQWYLLTGDEHWDSPECCLKLLHRHLKEAKERNALWISNGDFFDAISGRDDKRGSKGTLRDEHNKVNYLDRLVEDAFNEFRPYLDMLVYFGTGNHDQAITVKKETDIGQRLVDKINGERKQFPPIHRAGYTGWIKFMFELGTQRMSHAMKLEHGTGGNSPVTRGTIQTNRRQARTEGATWFVSSHIHEQWDLSRPVETLNSSSGRVELRKVKHVQLGSYKLDFRTDGIATWWTMKSGEPKPIGGSWLRLWSPNGREVNWEISDTWVDYPTLADQVSRSRIVREAVA